VKLIAQIKLAADPAQLQALRMTMHRVNEACNAISAIAWEKKTFGQFALHSLTYRIIRERFALSAQVAIRAVAKVADAYKLDRQRQRCFKPFGAITYDDRILSWKLDQSTVSIWTVSGRLKIPFQAGERQRRLLASRQGESDLVLFRGNFYLFAVCNVEEPEPSNFKDVLGVDLGIVNIATDSDGENFSGAHLNALRHRHRRLRAKLQSKGTKSAKRLLNRRRDKEALFARDVNHRISKRIVAKAQGTRRAIALEVLDGIRARVTVRHGRQRAALHSWAFFDLKQKIAYKAALAGVPVFSVDPRNTSRTCPSCGLVDKRNRPSQDVFKCIGCGSAGRADHIAAENIRRAAVNRPYAGTTCTSRLGHPVPASHLL
jgi:putative transposase